MHRSQHMSDDIPLPPEDPSDSCSAIVLCTTDLFVQVLLRCSLSLAESPHDVLAELGARLAVAAVGRLQLVSRAVRRAVHANKSLWAAQFRRRWVRAASC